MKDLDIDIRNPYEISIKDLTHDLDISEMKWDFLINHLLETTAGIYFYGLRLNYFDDDLKANIDFLLEESLFNVNNKFNRILFRIRPESLVIDRRVLKKIWELYESPSILFLKNIENEEFLAMSLFEDVYYPLLLEKVPGVYILYQEFAPDVLWGISNETLSELPVFYSK